MSLHYIYFSNSDQACQTVSVVVSLLDNTYNLDEERKHAMPSHLIVISSFVYFLVMFVKISNGVTKVRIGG